MSFVVSREDDFIPGFAAPGAANPSSSTRRGGAKQKSPAQRVSLGINA